MDLTAYELTRMANKAAGGFSETGDLNAEVAKLANDSELTPPQIQTLVEESNHEVNRRLYSAEDDKRYTFKVATLDGVLEQLNGAKDLPKVASVVQSGFNRLSVDTMRKTAAEATRVEPDWIRDPEMRLRETRSYLKKSAEKIQSYADECQAKLNYLTIKIGSTKGLALGEVKQLVRNGVPFSTIYKAAGRLHPDIPKAVRGIFEGLHTEYSKTASAVEKDLLKFDPAALDGKDEIGTRFVNGSHPLFIHLDDMAADLNQYSDINTCNDGLRNTFSALTGAIHDLNTPEDVNSYLANESQRFAYAVKKGMDSAIESIIELQEHFPKADGHKTDKVAGPRLDAFRAKYPRLSYATIPSGPGMQLVGKAVKAPFQLMGGGAKYLAGKGKQLVTTGRMDFPVASAVGKAVKSPLGIGTYKNPGLAGLAAALYAASSGLKGVGTAGSQLGNAALSGGSKSLGVGMA
jgi:hypothetical protein